MSNYHVDTALSYVNKTRDLLETFPPFLQDYFTSIATSTEARTRYGYAVDIKVFLEFIVKNHAGTFNDISEIKLEDLAHLEPVDIEEFMEHITLYKDEKGNVRKNGENGLSRKLSSIRQMFQYYTVNKRLQFNPAMAVRMPKIHKKDIIRMDDDEISDFLDYIENLEKNLEDNPHRLAYFKKTKYRDIAIITLLLGTGIRVSECVGLNLTDVSFRQNAICVTRKGGKVQNIYFNEEVAEALKNYIEIERQPIADAAQDNSPLFFSIQKKRMGVKSVENMVKKYAKEVVPLKPITVHKLRSSFGTSLYQATGDIFLVGDTLGHESIETTKRYAAMSESHRKEARNYVQLHRHD